jgi:hypothetical protein
MKTIQSTGIESLLKERKSLELRDVIRLHLRMTRDYPMPSITIENPKECRPGSPLTIKVIGIPAPAIDMYKGELLKSNGNKLDLPIYVSFRTTRGVITRPLRRLKKDQYSVILPEKMTNGLIGIFFPVEEDFGPPEIVKQFPPDILKWIKRSNHVSRSSLTKEDCPSPGPSGRDYRYLAMIAPQPFRFRFSTCTLCPYGALKTDWDSMSCYIDPTVCRGQKYSRSDHNPRGPEEICWNCFNDGDGAVSTKCDYVTLRKVLHLNPDAPRQEVPCCAGCELPTLCPNGAISTYEPPPPYRDFYSVDKNKCNGCMECYLNKDCPWNCGTMCTDGCGHYNRDAASVLYDGQGGHALRDVHNNYTMRMVSHIDNKLRFVLVKASVLRWMKDFSQSFIPYESYFDSNDGGPNTDGIDFDKFELIVWGDGVERIPVKLDKSGIHDFKRKEIPFTKDVHLGLFEKDSRLLGFQYCGLNIPIKSLGAKRYSDPTKLVEGGTFNFNSPIGKIQIEYVVK